MLEKPRVSEDDETWADAIVVGTGFGGAVTACRLAQAGKNVLVLERGRRYEANDFPTLPTDTELAPEVRRWTWGHDQGLWDVVDLEELVSVQAAGYGGGSLIYANVHLRPPAEVFDERWPATYAKGAVLHEFFDLAAYMLDVAPVSAHPEFQHKLVKADQLRKAADDLGRANAFFYPPLAIAYKTGPNIHGRHQKACTSCGSCCTGCPETAKSTLDFNYLANAERRGARVRTLCEVLDVEELDQDRWAVHCVDHLTGERLRPFVAPNVFLCAGSLHSTRLLARARLRRERKFKRLVGIGYFPGGDALGMVYDTQHPQHPSYGPTITTTTVHWESHAGASFFLLQDGGYAAALERLVGILRAPAWVGRNRLSSAGAARISASNLPSPPRPMQPPSGLILKSPFDEILDGISNGDFKSVASERQRQSISAFLAELKYPILFPTVVDSTIDASIRDRDKTCWLTRHLNPDSTLLKTKRAIEKWLIYKYFGDAETIAGRALDAMVSFGGLPRGEVAKRVLGYDAADPEKRTMLLAMGRDAASGVLHYLPDHDKLVADLDLFDLAPGYAREERLMTDTAGALGGELRTNPAWAFLGRPITVHNQGGCPMSASEADGVTTVDGQVHDCKGLYVLDGSILCTSVGVNPSATIAAIAERNVREFLRREHPQWPEGATGEGVAEYKRQVDGSKTWAANAKGWALEPPSVPSPALRSQPLGLTFHEVMEGYVGPTDSDPGRHDAEYRRLETLGRPGGHIKLELDAATDNLAQFFEDETHSMKLTGAVEVRLPGDATEARHPVTGVLELFVPRLKSYGIANDDDVRRVAHERLIDVRGAKKYTPRFRDPTRAAERFMTYDLRFVDRPNWSIAGYKRIRNDPGLDAWRDTASLFVAVRELRSIVQAGVAHVELDTFLFSQIPSITITGATNPVTGQEDGARATWATAKFASFFFGTLQRIYLPEIDSIFASLFRNPMKKANYERPRSGP
jgi:choline dehydrogenase-like flavoprotein